jgi:membrane protein
MPDTEYQRTYLLFDRQIHRFGEWLKHITLPGFEKVTIYDAFWFFLRGIQKGSLNIRASAIAFNFMLAIGPGVIFLLAMVPLIPIANFQQELLDVFHDIMPDNSYIAIESLLNEIFSKHGGLPLFGFLVSLFFAWKGISGMIEAFSSTYHEIETRPWYTQRLVAVVLVIVFYLLIIVAALIMFFSKTWLQRLLISGYIRLNFTYYMLLIGKWIIIVVLTYFCISFMYYLAPRRRTKFRFFSAGSSLATILTVIASLGFSYFVNQFAQFNKFFGSIGALIALMLWFNFNALTLLVGFELNASIKNANLSSRQ